MATLEDSKPYDPYDPEDPFGYDPMDSGVNWVVHQEQAEMLAIAQDLRAAALTVMEFKEAGQAPVVVISEESARRVRITGGEDACTDCGCSDSRRCEGGCVWATTALCSKCALKGYAGGAAGG